MKILQLAIASGTNIIDFSDGTCGTDRPTVHIVLLLYLTVNFVFVFFSLLVNCNSHLL